MNQQLGDTKDKPGPAQPPHYAFGYWHFNADSGDVTDGEKTTRLEPRVSRLLAYFLSHQDRLITRDELMAAVWENRIVSDDAINRSVSILRQTLSPEDKSAYIETVIRKGYVAHFPAATAAEPDMESKPGRRGFSLLAAIAVLAGLLAIAVYVATGDDDSSPVVAQTSIAEPPMVAVLPFTTASPTRDSAFFADGVHDDLLTQLSKLDSVRVISSTSMRAYRDVSRNLREIGEELGADIILEGSVQAAAGQIRINAQLIDARTDEHLWAETYDRPLTTESLFAVQSEIALAITDALDTTLSRENSRQLAILPTDNMAAYRAYHEAVQLRHASGANLSRPVYLQALERAVELDPNFSRAWAELVSTLAYLNFSGNNPQMTLRAEQALQHLQAIAPGSSDHLIGQAAYVYYALRDYDQAHTLIYQALELAPSDVNAIQLKSWIERRQGDFSASVDSQYQARRLDPRNPALNDALLMRLFFSHRYDEAWAEAQNSPGETYTSGYLLALQRFRENRDFVQLLESTRQLCRFSEEPDCGWGVYIANRDYPLALAALEPANNRAGTQTDTQRLSQAGRRRIFTLWLMQDDTLLSERLPQRQSQLALQEVLSQYRSEDDLINAALLAGVAGNTADAEALIERWERQTPADWAERMAYRHEVCRMLGMMAATESAVSCLRKGFAEPSWVMPFWEPYLPFYDAIREQQAFIDMLQEID